MEDSTGYTEGYEIVVKMVMLTYELGQLRSLARQWDLEFGCNLQEDSCTIRMILGNPRQMQFILCGRKTQTHACFEQAWVDRYLQEETMMELLNLIVCVQYSDKDTLGMIVSKNGLQVWPLVIRNGEIYDESRMMDILWNHYAVTRVKEARRMEEVYHFLRDVPKHLWTWIAGTIGNFFFLQPFL